MVNKPHDLRQLERLLELYEHDVEQSSIYDGYKSLIRQGLARVVETHGGFTDFGITDRGRDVLDAVSTVYGLITKKR